MKGKKVINVNGNKGTFGKKIEKLIETKKCPKCNEFFPMYDYSKCPNCRTKLKKVKGIAW
jgi:Zn finger protein HypA/HybF involved in hydrogenase expression